MCNHQWPRVVSCSITVFVVPCVVGRIGSHLGPILSRPASVSAQAPHRVSLEQALPGVQPAGAGSSYCHILSLLCGFYGPIRCQWPVPELPPVATLSRRASPSAQALHPVPPARAPHHRSLGTTSEISVGGSVRMRNIFNRACAMCSLCHACEGLHQHDSLGDGHQRDIIHLSSSGLVESLRDAAPSRFPNLCHQGLQGDYRTISWCRRCLGFLRQRQRILSGKSRCQQCQGLLWWDVCGCEVSSSTSATATLTSSSTVSSSTSAALLQCGLKA